MFGSTWGTNDYYQSKGGSIYVQGGGNVDSAYFNKRGVGGQNDASSTDYYGFETYISGSNVNFVLATRPIVERSYTVKVRTRSNASLKTKSLSRTL